MVLVGVYLFYECLHGTVIALVKHTVSHCHPWRRRPLIKGLVNAAAFVPEGQCSGLPTQAVTEGWLSDMLLKEGKQTLRLRLGHPLDAGAVRMINVQGFFSRLRMSPNHWMKPSINHFRLVVVLLCLFES